MVGVLVVLPGGSRGANLEAPADLVVNREGTSSDSKPSLCVAHDDTTWIARKYDLADLIATLPEEKISLVDPLGAREEPSRQQTVENGCHCRLARQCGV